MLIILLLIALFVLIEGFDYAIWARRLRDEDEEFEKWLKEKEDKW